MEEELELSEDFGREEWQNDEDEPSCEPECPKSIENDDIECEFENRDGSWWCTTHNCYA